MRAVIEIVQWRWVEIAHSPSFTIALCTELRMKQRLERLYTVDATLNSDQPGDMSFFLSFSIAFIRFFCLSQGPNNFDGDKVLIVIKKAE